MLPSHIISFNRGDLSHGSPNGRAQDFRSTKMEHASSVAFSLLISPLQLQSACSVSLVLLGCVVPVSSRPNQGITFPQQIAPFLRIYRNYLIGDLAFFTLFAGPASSAIFDPTSRSIICEHISRHEHFLRDAVELGFNPENCEQWFERGVMVFMAFLIFVIIVRVRCFVGRRFVNILPIYGASFISSLAYHAISLGFHISSHR